MNEQTEAQPPLQVQEPVVFYRCNGTETNKQLKENTNG
jgi:hypothetical protein